MNSHKKEKSKSALEEEERRKLVRKEWFIQQQEERNHEARKLKMIEEYERRRAQTLKIDHKQRSLRRSKSHSPQRRTTDYILKALEELKISSPSNYRKNTIICEKELRKIKIDIYNGRVCKTSQNTSKYKIDRDIGNLDDIALPRRKGEGTHSIFEKIKTQDGTIRFLQDDKLEKQLSDEESTDTWTSTPSDTYKKVTINTVVSINSHKKEKSKSALSEEKNKIREEARLKMVRQEWYIQQQEERNHEARKLKMIEEYERRRAQTLKIDHKQRSLRSKSHSPQRRTTDYILKASEELKISSPSNYKKNTIIDEKDQDLRKNKINIYNGRVCKTSQNISKNKIDRDIGNLDDIALPRRKEKQLSDEESTDTWKSTPFDTYKKVTQYRSISSPPSNRAKERKQDYDENKFSSRRSRSREQDYDENKFSSRRSRSHEQVYDENKFSSRRNRSCEPDVRVSSSHSELATNCPPSYISYNTRMRFPGPMYRIQAPPMIWPIAPGLFPAPFPQNMSRWRSPHPPRFSNYNLGGRFYRGPC